MKVSKKIHFLLQVDVLVCHLSVVTALGRNEITPSCWLDQEKLAGLICECYGLIVHTIPKTAVLRQLHTCYLEVWGSVMGFSSSVGLVGFISLQSCYIDSRSAVSF